MVDEEIGALKEKRICSACVQETFLSKMIGLEGKRETCDYCSKRRRTFGIGRMAELVEAAFAEHYERTPDEMTSDQARAHHDPEGDYNWEREGEPVVYAIQGAASIPDEAAEDIQKILKDKHAGDPFDGYGEDEFDDESHYQEKLVNEDPSWQREWHDFEHSLKTESRYFSEHIDGRLQRIFNGIQNLPIHGTGSLIEEVGPDKPIDAFYRARVFETFSDAALAMKRPDLLVGPPPAAHARSGRMNAAGISVFYGATEAQTALAEIRPPVGAQCVVARFKLRRTLHLLNLKSFANIRVDGSIFDPTFSSRIQHGIFLRRLVQRITIPVMPHEEALAYLPTQVVAEFLASRKEPKLDGILFPSVQTGGLALNVVLFQKAARVAEIDLPRNAKLRLHTGDWYEEGFEPDLAVIETIPAAPEPQKERSFDEFLMSEGEEDFVDRPASDSRIPTLEVDLPSVELHTVSGVSIQAHVQKVDRRRVVLHENNDRGRRRRPPY